MNNRLEYVDAIKGFAVLLFEVFVFRPFLCSLFLFSRRGDGYTLQKKSHSATSCDNLVCNMFYCVVGFLCGIAKFQFCKVPHAMGRSVCDIYLLQM